MIWLLGVPGVWYEAQLYGGGNAVERRPRRLLGLGLGLGLSFRQMRTWRQP